MATAALPLTRPAADADAVPRDASRPPRAPATSGTVLLTLFSAATILAVLLIAALVASPSWVMLGIALSTNVVLTGAILAALARYLES